MKGFKNSSLTKQLPSCQAAPLEASQANSRDSNHSHLNQLQQVHLQVVVGRPLKPVDSVLTDPGMSERGSEQLEGVLDVHGGPLDDEVQGQHRFARHVPVNAFHKLGQRLLVGRQVEAAKKDRDEQDWDF